MFLLPFRSPCDSKPADAYSVISMMKYAGHSQRARTWTNVGFALLCPVVALASFGGGWNCLARKKGQ